MHIDIAPVRSYPALGEAWRAFEAEVPHLSFFQSWTWIGCLAEERYSDPIVVRADAGGRLLGMALFNRHRDRLCLTETGAPALDAPFIEHNAPLLAAGAEPEVLPALLRAAQQVPGIRRVVLSGVPPAVAAAAGGILVGSRERQAPFVDLKAIRAAGGDWLATLSANTRYQLRRSARRYAERGPVSASRAVTEDEALSWLDSLVALHVRTWNARGLPGAFATPYLMRFHQALVARSIPRQELELLRVSAGSDVIGYLYNFSLRGCSYAYQSGFDAAGSQEKPGLTCHALAVERALRTGQNAYDFLAGAARYKLSLAKTSTPLVWTEAVHPWSVPGLVSRLRERLGTARRYLVRMR